MAANPIVVVNHGMIEIPQSLQGDPRFRHGARLQLMPILQEQSEEDRLSAWKAFRSLKGILAHPKYDPNAELEKEKQRELADEAGWPKK